MSIKVYHIIPNTNETIILGMCFICENDAIINIRKNTLTLDGVKYEILKDNETSNSVEGEIMSKTKVFKMNEDIEFEELIEKYKKNNPRIGNMTLIEHRIKLLAPFNIIEKEYNVPIGMQKEVEDHINELINNGIIIERDSLIISLAFIIKKKNRKIRLVVDYRKLNEITKKAHQITPPINEVLAKLHGSVIYSSIDLNQGYYQIRVSEEDVFKTGLKILNRKFFVLKMPFGLSNAPATFQNAMNKMFKGMDNVILYLDDILIYSRNKSEHYQQLKKVFEILEGHKVSINFEKCIFNADKINFLGHEISKDGIRPNISKLENFEFKKPRSKKQLEKILGFVNWYRPFIQNLSILTAPLYEKLKGKDKKISWTKGDTEILSSILSKLKYKTSSALY
ncbi:Retrovirus-related Pol polyprotein from transposon 17.6 [Dictyocoela muelleri]|nr:Retrovirus-related Pol polyprotein from transposon 17.6 [Dictyocoela muelleri]